MTALLLGTRTSSSALKTGHAPSLQNAYIPRFLAHSEKNADETSAYPEMLQCMSPLIESNSDKWQGDSLLRGNDIAISSLQSHPSAKLSNLLREAFKPIRCYFFGEDFPVFYNEFVKRFTIVFTTRITFSFFWKSFHVQ